MKQFRYQHEELIKVIKRVLNTYYSKIRAREESEAALNKEGNLHRKSVTSETPHNALTDSNILESIDLAYNKIKAIDALDVTPEGNRAYEQAKKLYGEKIDQVETEITAYLREQLGAAKSSKEMFEIFNRFNPLFVRGRIGGAIKEYQTQLLQSVSSDIEALKVKFKQGYQNSTARYMSASRDIGPTSGQMIWCRQIQVQLDKKIAQIEAVLGKDWTKHTEGKKLAEEGVEFKRKLDTTPLVEQWMARVSNKNIGFNGSIFRIDATRAPNQAPDDPIARQNTLKVNYHPEAIRLKKECDSLKMNHRLPLPILNKTYQANQLYPVGVHLNQAISSYTSTLAKLSDRKHLAPLITNMRRQVENQISNGAELTWESYKLESYTAQLSEITENFQNKVEELIESDERIKNYLSDLKTCKYQVEDFNNIVSLIQDVIDELALHSFSNVPNWVDKLDLQIENILSERLVHAVEAWTDCLTGKRKEYEEESALALNNNNLANELPEKIIELLKYQVKIKPIDEGFERQNNFDFWAFAKKESKKLVSFWAPFGLHLGSFWVSFGLILGSFWADFGLLLGSLWF